MDNEIRMIRKRFKCTKCETKRSKLVQANEVTTSCDNCEGVAREISENEYNQKTREEINQNYRMVFDNTNSAHSRFDVNDRSANNVNGDTSRKFRRERENIGENGQGNNRWSNNSIERERSRDYQYNMGGQNRFNNYNIYNERRRSPENNNFFNYYNNSRTNQQQSRPRREQERNNNTDNAASNDVFSNFFGNFGNLGGNFNLNINNNVRSSSNRSSNRFPYQDDFFGNFFQGFGVNFPFGESPFMGRISRHNFDDDIFDPGFETFGSTFNNFFRDNFSSNFRSNFRSNDNFFDIFTMLRNRNAENANETRRPPTAKKALKSLKKFKMNEKYCKKNDKGDLEYPNCCICISDINNGEETVLLPCGHMFHSPCVVEWLKKNNTCPVCRFELPAEQE